MKKLFLTAVMSLLFATPVLADANFVQRVIDGQTLKLISGEEVRLIGISIDEDKSAASGEFVRRLVSGSIVELEYDVQKKDENGDLLAYVWFEYQFTGQELENFKFPENYEVRFLEDEAGFGSFYVLLNATVVKSGYASPDADSKNMKHASLIDQLYEEQKLKAAGTLASAKEDLISAVK